MSDQPQPDALRTYEERLHLATSAPTADARAEAAMLLELHDQDAADAYVAAWVELHLGPDLAWLVAQWRAASDRDRDYLLACGAAVEQRRDHDAGEEWKL
jgi:hypothetical protein